MTQDQWLTLVFKVSLISGFISIVFWIALYTALAPWWRNSIGRTIVIKSVIIAMIFIPTMLSLFFNLNRFDSRITGWVDAILIFLVTPAMIWRSIVWWKLHKDGRDVRQ